MRQLGLSPSESAIIVSIKCFVAAAFQPVFGFVADKLQRHKPIMLVCLVTSSIFLGCLLFVPPTTHDVDRNGTGDFRFFCGINNSYMVICGEEGDKNIANNTTQHNTSTIHNFTCAMSDMVTSLRIFGTGPSGAPQYLDVAMDTNSFDILIEFGSLPLPFMETERNYCQYLAVVSVNNSVSNTLSDVHCGNNKTFSCHPQYPLITDHASDLTRGESRKFSITFWLFGFIFVISDIVNAPTYTLLDALTYSHLGDERAKWGSQRMWGTIGYSVFGIATGYAMDAIKWKTGDINYAWCFAFFFLNNLLATLSVYCYNTSNEVKCSKPMQKLHQLLKNLEVLSLYLLVFVLGVFRGVIETFRFWHLQNLGAPQLLLGLCLVMSRTPEIVVMFAMKYILKLVGERSCLYLACVAFACRFLGYSFLRNPWFVLLVEPLHGLTYGLMYGAASAYGSRLTPEGMHGTMQAMLMTLHIGFG